MLSPSNEDFSLEEREKILYWAGRGKAIQTGFNALQQEAIKNRLTLSPETAFFAGAGYVFALQMIITANKDADPTNRELELLSKVYEELADFDKKLILQMTPPASDRAS